MSSNNKKQKHELTKVVSKRIREVRKEKQFTQQELAEKAGLHLTYVGHLEIGKYHPSVFVLWKIAKVLEVDLDSLTS